MIRFHRPLSGDAPAFPPKLSDQRTLYPGYTGAGVADASEAMANQASEMRMLSISTGELPYLAVVGVCCCTVVLDVLRIAELMSQTSVRAGGKDQETVALRSVTGGKGGRSRKPVPAFVLWEEGNGEGRCGVMSPQGSFYLVGARLDAGPSRKTGIGKRSDGQKNKNRAR